MNFVKAQRNLFSKLVEVAPKLSNSVAKRNNADENRFKVVEKRE